MAENIVLNDVVTFANDTSAVNVVNGNNATITNAFIDVLSRSGVSPNQMNSSLDMNSNQILNLPPPASINSPARLIDVSGTISVTVPPTGTSGAVVGFLNGNNTVSGNNTYTGTNTFSNSIISSFTPAFQTSSSGIFFNQLQVLNDTTAVTTIGGTNNATPLLINYTYGGSTAQGPKTGLQVVTTLNTTPSNVSPFYAAADFFCQSNANATGTSLASVGQTQGTCEGLLIFSALNSGATFYRSLVGAEITVGANTGSSTFARHGTSIVSSGNVNAPSVSGVQEDAAIHLGTITGSVPWVNGIYLSHWNGIAPLSTSGFIISSDGSSDTIGGVINLPSYTVSGNVFNFSNFQVAGNGNTKIFPTTGAASLTINNVDGGNKASVLAQSAGTTKWEYGKDASGNFYILDSTAGSNILQAAPNGAMIIAPKGTLQINNATQFSTNGAVATALTSVGPTGSHTTVQTWLTILDNTGATRYIPCF